ncbi:MarR family winged helix-turn-helix transcriptional regulator [Accumulibacter sp.]|uniref:MarR family winged helix-turn-helix transcriptional regulator n=1 Tax=Accumulibacter sp. TaxID=2053492 RepID=UPI0025E1DFCF|nr:MarR family winged helix-turn-helix transcriptional regulator [Accumulibacter sp.]MCM8612752.1 MarR family winged helix-turn-helix transcriptional regulator [Accumulibacter sp.]MCM8637658.1 MarR family winged helix-turn-helix transcriptional regulator [Accumulibacter sp.]MCM8639685.1 MarR family winged helix-turn-helix transcriptional regulator [Accumulibacter sp.]
MFPWPKTADARRTIGFASLQTSTNRSQTVNPARRSAAACHKDPWNRQNVQRIVNDLEMKGLVRLASNPHHWRASLVMLTDKGRQAFDAAIRLAAPWINKLAVGLSVDAIAGCTLQQVHPRERGGSSKSG